jgi:hypothetical protein
MIENTYWTCRPVFVHYRREVIWASAVHDDSIASQIKLMTNTLNALFGRTASSALKPFSWNESRHMFKLFSGGNAIKSPAKCFDELVIPESL